MTQTDWHRVIDTSFDDGPQVGAPPQETLRNGHRALRRRRLRAGGIAGGAVLATTLLVSAVASWPSDPVAPGQTAESRAPSAAAQGPTQEPRAGAREVYRTAVGPLYLDRETGDLLLPDDWRELDRILDPFGPGSIALEITDGGPSLYVLATLGGGHRGLIVIADSPPSTLEEFVASARDDFARVQREEGRG